MIDPKLLTPENGFVDGCVVMVTWDDESHEPMFFEDFMRVANGSPFVMKTASIYPLTGPMAIWNFAPEWAKFAEVRLGGIAWLIETPEWWDGDSKVIQQRPFWARSEK